MELSFQLHRVAGEFAVGPRTPARVATNQLGPSVSRELDRGLPVVRVSISPAVWPISEAKTFASGQYSPASWTPNNLIGSPTSGVSALSSHAGAPWLAQ
jgi:hypothetical protein